MAASLEIDKNWAYSPIQTEKKCYDAYRRVGGSINDDYPFIREHLHQVVNAGGVLLRHEHDWKVTEESFDAWGNKSYRLAPDKTDVWYLPKCSFEESLELLQVFGFPGRQVCHNSESVRQLSMAVLMQLERNRRLAIVSITSEAVNVERVDGPDFTTAEMTRLLEFNQAHFGIKYTKTEFLDLRRLYRRKGFCILGRM